MFVFPEQCLKLDVADDSETVLAHTPKIGVVCKMTGMKTLHETNENSDSKSHPHGNEIQIPKAINIDNIMSETIIDVGVLTSSELHPSKDIISREKFLDYKEIVNKEKPHKVR